MWFHVQFKDAKNDLSHGCADTRNILTSASNIHRRRHPCVKKLTTVEGKKVRIFMISSTLALLVLSPTNHTCLFLKVEGVSFTLGDAQSFSGLTSKIPPLGSMLNY